MIAIADYGINNLFSVANALNYLGVPNVITDAPSELERADSIILPGVGAFPDAADAMEAHGLSETLRREAKRGKPILGICLGAQLLFEKGFEVRESEGLGLISGIVRKIEAPGLKIPHMGWNSLVCEGASPLLKGISPGSYVYFVHSFLCDAAPENVAAYAEYGERIPAVVQNKNVFGTQFHPEKSGHTGLSILKNFSEVQGADFTRD